MPLMFLLFAIQLKCVPYIFNHPIERLKKCRIPLLTPALSMLNKNGIVMRPDLVQPKKVVAGVPKRTIEFTYEGG